jgi:hypothetical protein
MTAYKCSFLLYNTRALAPDGTSAAFQHVGPCVAGVGWVGKGPAALRYSGTTVRYSGTATSASTVGAKLRVSIHTTTTTQAGVTAGVSARTAACEARLVESGRCLRRCSGRGYSYFYFYP